MKRAAVTIGTVCLLLFAACTTGPEGPHERRSGSAGPVPGGTLRVAVPDEMLGNLFLDPSLSETNLDWELFRCCLVRTMYSYNGRPTDRGGVELRPDLADGMPTVSDDGLTWTIRLKPDVRFAPPFDDRTIVADDLVRALERNAGLSGDFYPSQFEMIDGYSEYRSGEADSISGLAAPDDRTLIVRLDEPAADLAYRFSLPATAPIPEGASDGHDDDYARFLVASGPYMIDGSRVLDFGPAPSRQSPLPGFVPARYARDGSLKKARGSLMFVRNPSWERSADPLRPAFPDRIEFALGGSDGKIASKVDRGAIDLAFSWNSSPREQVRAYQNDPEMDGRLSIDRKGQIFFVTMNLAVPPFDDVRVRRAVSLAIDKEALVRMIERPPYGPDGVADVVIASHLAPDSLEGDLLGGPDPNPHDVARAREEMRRSRYDRDGDGRCDARACRRVRVLVWDTASVPEQARAIKKQLADVGIWLDLDDEPRHRFYEEVDDPSRATPMIVTFGWGALLPVASTWFDGLVTSSGFGGDSNANPSMIGATPAQLREWGYGVTSVPSVDDRFRTCLQGSGSDQLACWAHLDQYLTNEVVPMIPYAEAEHAQTLSRRVTSYSFDQFADMPALDRIALARGSR